MIGLFMADGEAFIEGEILVADIVPTNSSRRELNLSALSTIAVSVVFLLLAVSFGEAIVESFTNFKDNVGDFISDVNPFNQENLSNINNSGATNTIRNVIGDREAY